MEGSWIHRIQVRNDELDSFGHVNHARYLHYLEDARWAFLEQCGLSLTELRRRGWSIVATEARLRYRAPAFGREILEVRTRVIPQGPVRSLWRQEIHRPRDQRLLLEAEIMGAFLDERGRPMPLPEEIRRRLMGPPDSKDA
jgi:YbgC/YbaW family acyl-CoA thioester hydrolase